MPSLARPTFGTGSPHLRRSRPALPLLGLVLLLTLNSCQEMAELRSFAGRSQQAVEAYAEIAADCRRSLFFQNYLLALADGKTPPTTAYQRAVEASEQDPLTKSLDGFQASSQVLANYFSAMSALTSNELVAFEDEISAVTAKLDGAAKIKPAEKAAVTKLANFLFNGLAGARQRKALRSTVAGNDAAVTGAMEVLETAAQVHAELLANEQTALRSFFDGPAADLRSRLDPIEGASAAQLADQAATDAVVKARLQRAALFPLQEGAFSAMQNLARQRTRLQAFEKALQQAKKTHHQLATAPASFQSQEVARQAGAAASAINAALRAFR